MNWNAWSGSVFLLFFVFLLFRFAHCQDQSSTAFETNLDPDTAQVRTFFDDLIGNHDDQRTGKALEEGRTFGAHKRMQFMLMPLIYKMGVMMTLMGVLTVISLKGLMIGTILLVLKLSAIFGKLYATWHSHGSYGHQAPAAWTPPQPVHVHLHNDGYGGHGQAYHGWENVQPHNGPPTDDGYYYKG